MERNVLFVGAEPTLITHLQDILKLERHRFFLIEETGEDETSEQEIIKAVDNIIEEAGKIDVLIIGLLYKGESSFDEITFDSYEKFIHKSVHTPFLYAKTCVRKMERERFGRIIILTSTVAQLGDLDALPAIASGSLEVFVKSAAREEAKKGITINALSLGYIENWQATDSHSVKQFHDHHFPYKTTFNLRDVANEIKELAINENGLLNGQIIRLDGGTL